MYKCPYPECEHIAAYAILNSHAKTHGYYKVTEMTKEHGPIKKLGMDPKHIKYARESTHSLHKSSYNDSETAMTRLQKAERKDVRNREG